MVLPLVQRHAHAPRERRAAGRVGRVGHRLEHLELAARAAVDAVRRADVDRLLDDFDVVAALLRQARRLPPPQAALAQDEGLDYNQFDEEKLRELEGEIDEKLKALNRVEEEAKAGGAAPAGASTLSALIASSMPLAEISSVLFSLAASTPMYSLP